MADGHEHRIAKQRAVLDALQLFGKLWPRKFSPGVIQADLEVWVDACRDAPTAYVVHAARQLIASARSGTFPPKPADLSDLARKLDREAAPDQMPRGGPYVADHVPPPPKDLEAIPRLGLMASARLGSWRLASEVWGLLWLTATTDDERAMVREGRVPAALFAEAVEKVAGGYRPQSGPLGRVVA
jgi:hypothetical protein